MVHMEQSPWKILLVEDDEDDYVLTRSLLSDGKPGQFVLDWVQSYAEGLEALTSCSHDVYLVDYRLGNADGLELVQEALASGCRAPIILMTGQGSLAVDMEAMRAGATDYLPKGELSGPLLERTIRYAIQAKQSEALLTQRSVQLSTANQQLQASAKALRLAHDKLEERVQERTRELAASKDELARANEALHAEIAERKKIEDALRKSETRFRTLAETTSSAIFILEGGRIRYANPAVQTITGYHPQELLDRDFWVIAHPTYQEVLKKSGLAGPWRSFGAIPTRYEIKLLTRNGQERWIDLSIGEMALDEGTYLVVTGFDITERDLAEQALRKAKRELEERISALEKR
jgi:PAS domain S-box-containing protein